MSTLTIGEAETDARAFAREFPTPNVLAAIAYAEAGEISWHRCYELFRKSLATSLNTVNA